MEKVTRLIRSQLILRLETDAGSTLLVLPGGMVVMAGFLDAPSPAVQDFSQRLHHRDGVLYLELNNHRGSVQQIPVAKVDDSPAFRAWLGAADRIIP